MCLKGENRLVILLLSIEVRLSVCMSVDVYLFRVLYIICVAMSPVLYIFLHIVSSILDYFLVLLGYVWFLFIYMCVFVSYCFVSFFSFYIVPLVVFSHKDSFSGSLGRWLVNWARQDQDLLLPGPDAILF